MNKSVINVDYDYGATVLNKNYCHTRLYPEKNCMHVLKFNGMRLLPFICSIKVYCKSLTHPVIVMVTK